jgi:hypothetical protein
MMELCGWRPQNDITVLDSKHLSRLPRQDSLALQQIIDSMGAGSARAQSLGAVITTYDKLMIAPNQRLYMMADRAQGTALGLLKMGAKKLFVRSGDGCV